MTDLLSHLYGREVMKCIAPLFKIFLITSWLFACTNTPALVQPIPSEAASPYITININFTSKRW